MPSDATQADPATQTDPIASFITQEALGFLVNAARGDAQAVSWAAYDFLQGPGSHGLPMVSIIDGSARDDARFWAETASPAELECYSLAAMDRLASTNAPFASRQIKRLVASLWRRLSPDEKTAFVMWLHGQYVSASHQSAPKTKTDKETE